MCSAKMLRCHQPGRFMFDSSIVLQHPAHADELVLLFHGVGAMARSMAPLGVFLAQHAPKAALVSVQAPNPSSLGQGFEWFSVKGGSEANRTARIVDALPSFLDAVRHWQQAVNLTARQTTLIGFSQGAIMCLHAAVECAEPGVAGRVFSLAGRFAVEPDQAPADVRFHLVHGEQDEVIAADYSIQAARSLQRLNRVVSIDLLPRLGHSIDQRVAHLIQARRSPLWAHLVVKREFALHERATCLDHAIHMRFRPACFAR